MAVPLNVTVPAYTWLLEEETVKLTVPLGYPLAAIVTLLYVKLTE